MHHLHSNLFRIHRVLLGLVVAITLLTAVQQIFHVEMFIPTAFGANDCPGGLPGPLDVATAFWTNTPISPEQGNEYLKCEIQNIYNIGFYVAVGLATIMVVIGGIRYTTAGGNSSEAGEAKTMIKEALIGLGIALLAASFTAFLQS